MPAVGAIFDRFNDEGGSGGGVPPSGGPSKAGLRQMLSNAVANTAGARKVEQPNDRRFTDKPDLNPGAVRSLPGNHPALTENRTLFPSTVVEVDEHFSDRLLVSGKNNRKLGERILKGKFKGYALYGLSLEERATCPSDCGARDHCYGNGMQMARRHKIGDANVFFQFLETEITALLADPIDGLMVRLHVLGDFPSVEYVAFWSDMLAEHDRLACYGYTHRRTRNWGGDEIGDAVEALKDSYPERFRIRWSSDVARPDGAVIIARQPEGPQVPEGIVCPAQTDATACCASCGMCWDASTMAKSIVFIKHGPKSAAAAEASRVAALAVEEPPLPVASEIEIAPVPSDARQVKPIKLPPNLKPQMLLGEVPVVRMVSPLDLVIEESYQRDLSGKSIKLIRKIVTGWDWAKFKPPVVAQTHDGLFVIDGQHTAIAAASHPAIVQIPVLIVGADKIEQRAAAFVAHNRDRLTMTPAQVFYGEVAAGNAAAIGALGAVERGGGSIPRLPVQKNYAKPGQITAVNEVRKIFARGADLLERVIRIAVLSRVAPITATITSAISMVLMEKPFADVAEMQDRDIARALESVKNIEAVAQHYAAETGQSRYRAAAALLAQAARGEQS